MTGENRDLYGYGRNAPDPRWPDGARIALQFVLNVEEGAEQCILNGDDGSETYLQEIPGRQPRVGARDRSVESMYEYGSRCGFWRVLRIFAAYDLPLTAFAVGRSLELNPAAGHALAEAGHEIAGHGYRWIDYSSVDPETEREHIARTAEIIRDISGKSPAGWYTGRCSEYTRQLLIEHGGFKYDSDAYNDDLPYWSAAEPAHLVIPYSLVTNDFRYLSGGGPDNADSFYRHLCSAFDVLWREGKTSPKIMSVGLHSRISGHPARADALIRFIDYVLTHNDVWICTREQIADHWHSHFSRNPDFG